MKILGKKKIVGGTSVDAILLIIAKLITTGAGLIITRLLSQFLSIHDYGTYSQILLIVSTVTSVTILGMIDGVNYFYCNEQDPEKRESYIATIFALQSIVGTVSGILVMALTVPLCSYFDNADIKKLLIFAAVLPLFQNLFWLYHMLIVSIGKAKMLALRNLINAVVKLVSFSLIVLNGGGVLLILTTTLVIDILQLIYFGAVIHRNGCRIRFSKIRFRLSKEILKYCLPMAMFVMINSLNRDMDKYIISLWMDTESLAVYSNAAKTLPFDIIMTTFCTVLMPKITRMIAAKEYKRTTQTYRHFLELSYISTGILCCAALSAAPQLMTLLYSKNYLAGLSVFCVYILVDLVRFMSVTVILSAAGKTKTLLWLGVVALGCNAVLNVVLYQALGMVGPAIATLISTVFLGIWMLKLSAKELHAKLKDFFDWKFVLLFWAESVALTISFGLLQKWLASLGWHYIIVLIVICSLYCGVMLLLNGKRLLQSLKKINQTEAKQDS